MADDEFRIAFTDVLYGVVIGNAIYSLEFGLTMTNLLMAFALVVIADDWVAYKVSLAEAEPTLRNHFMAYILDFAILVTWYFLTIVPQSSLHWYMAVLAVFFALGGLWGIAVMDETFGEAIRGTHGILTFVFVSLAGIGVIIDARIQLLILGGAIFVVLRLRYWSDELDQRVGAI